MDNAQIDKAILAAVGASWMKVAMVVVKAADAQGSHLPDGEDVYKVVAKRVEALVRDGHLVAQGDIRKWRHSEVRRPQKS